MIVSNPFASACRESAPITSSASYPGNEYIGIPNASRSCLHRSNCGRSSSGIGRRVALYVASRSWRNVGTGRSKAAAMCCGVACSSDLRRIEANPNVAFASSPLVVVSGGTAKNAR